MKLLTTIQVRKIMRKHGGEPLYTNKTTGDISDNRRVKCYYNGNEKMLKKLRKKCGKENVTLTSGGNYEYGSYSGWGGPGVVVRCVLA